MAVTGGKEMSGDPAAGPPPRRVDAFISYRRLPADIRGCRRSAAVLPGRDRCPVRQHADADRPDERRDVQCQLRGPVGGVRGRERGRRAAPGRRDSSAPLRAQRYHHRLSFGTSDDDLLVLTARDIYLWQPLSGHRPLVIPQPSAPIDAAVSQSGTVLAAAGAGGTVEVWSAVDGRHIRSLRTVKTPSQSYFSPTPLRVAISAAGDVVASGNADGTVFLWNVSMGKRIAIQRVSTWPIIELSEAAGAPRLLAVDWPQAGSGVNPAGSASVLNSAAGQVVAAYRSPAPLEAPVDPAAALSADGNFLFAGALGLAPSAPGGIEAAYQVSGSQLMAGLQTAAEPPTTSYSELPAQPWSPDGARLLAGNSIYPCDACGPLAELQAAAATRIAWARPLSTVSDHPPTSNPYG